MATLQFKRIKKVIFPNLTVLKQTVGSEGGQYALQPGEPIVASYRDGDAIRTVLAVASAQGGIEFIDYDGLEARVATAEEAVKGVNFITKDSSSLSLKKDTSTSETVLSGKVKLSPAAGNVLEINGTEGEEGLYAKVLLDKNDSGNLVFTTKSGSKTIPLDKEVHLALNGSFYNPITKSLDLKLTDGSTVQVDLTNVVNVADVDDNIIQDKALGLYASTDLRYDAARNILYFFRSGSEPKEIKLNSTQILDDVTYDSIKEAIIIRFIMQSGEFKVLEVPVSQLIREWQPYNDMHTVQIERTENKTGGQDLLSADVKIASDPDNILTKKNYQLYVKGIASNIKYSADPSSGVTVKDKIDELQGDVSKVSSAVDTFNDAIEYVENIVSAVSGVSEAKINAIINGAGLEETTGKYRRNENANYISGTGVTSLAKADNALDRELFSLSGKVSANTEAIQFISGQVSANTTAITSNTAAITAEKTARETMDDKIMDILSGISGSAPTTVVDKIIESVGLDEGGDNKGVYKPADTAHTFICSATSVLDADIRLDAAVQAVSGQVSGLSATVASISGVSQAEIDRIESGAGLSSDGTYIKDTDGTAFILSATSLANADNILDKAIKSISGKVDSLSGVNQAEIEEISGVASSTSGIVQNMLRDEALSGDGAYHPVQNTFDDPNPIIGKPSISSFTKADKALQSAIVDLSGKVTSDSGVSGDIAALNERVEEKADEFTPGQTDSITLHFDTTDPNETKLLGDIRLDKNPLDCHYLNDSGQTTHTGYINNILQVNSGYGVAAYASLDYDPVTNALYWSNGDVDASGQTIGKTIKLNAGSIIDALSATTGADGKLIILYHTESSTEWQECSIPLSAFSTIAVADGAGVRIDNTSGGSAVYTLQANAKIDTDPVNILGLTSTGYLTVPGLASKIRFYDNPSLSAHTVQTIVSGLSADVQTISADVETHTSILSGISASTEYINTIPNILSGVGLDENGNYLPVTAGTRFTSGASAVSGATQALDKAIQEVISGAGLTADGKYDKDRFSGSTILSASSSLTDAIEDLSEFTEKGFLSGCGLTSAGTINVNAFSGSSVLSGLTTGNSLTDAIVDLDEAFEACCDAALNAIGNIDEDGNWEIPSAVTEALSGSGIDSGSSISDVLAALAENGLSIEDFYNDPADPQDREYNVVFSTVIGDDGKPKIAADVEFFDCGDYDQP